MKRKKQGASLIVVVIIFMFVSIVSMATLSMIAGNYKARIIESKRVENLYASESGLNVAYNIIGKTFGAAAQYGDLKVKQLKNKTSPTSNDTSPYNKDYIALKNDIDYWKAYNSNNENKKKSQKEIEDNIKKDNDLIDDLINREFKRAFNNFILDSENIGSNEEAPNKLKQSIREGTYVNVVKDVNNEDKDYDIATVQFQTENAPILWIPEQDQENPQKVVEVIDGIKPDENNEKYTIVVKSEFKTQAEKTNSVGDNSRTVQATYTMSVPNYSDIYFQKSTGDLKEYLAIQDRGLTIGGNMYVNNLNNLTVDGGIFVKGNSSNVTPENITYQKYLGGITLNNSKAVTFNNDVITANTFNVVDNINATINGNLYARNVYAGKIQPGNLGVANGSTLNIDNKEEDKGQVIIDNDITLKANSTKINIDKFYGINDKTIKSDVDKAKEKNSSCIIVNGNSSSNVNIKTSAYIMGVAYIDTKDEAGTQSQPYKTGESVAVKGNYIAYAIPDLNKPYETFSYYNPLYLLDYDGGGDEVSQKSEHFKNYWYGKLKDENTGGISLPNNTKSIGAIVYKDSAGKLQVKNDRETFIGSDTEQNIILPKRREYAKKVYNMGQPEKDDNDLTEKEKVYLQDLYDSKPGVSSQYTVDTLMKFPPNFNPEDNIYGYKRSDELKNDVKEKAIFNSTGTEIVIQGDNFNNTNNTNKIVIDALHNKEIHAVIATYGKVTIDGDVNFKGTIIAKGNLDVIGKTGNKKTSITYDPEVVEGIEAKYTDLFRDVFGNANYIEKTPISSGNEIANPNYDLNKFLNIKLWKLIH